MIRLLQVLAVMATAVLAALFAYRNPGAIRIQYYGGIDWQVDLPLLLIGVFCAGLACAGLVGWLKLINLRRQLNQLRRQGGAD